MCVDTFSPSINEPWSYVGNDCVAQMIIKLNKLAQEGIKEMKANKARYGYNREGANYSVQSDLFLSLKKEDYKVQKSLPHDRKIPRGNSQPVQHQDF